MLISSISFRENLHPCTPIGLLVQITSIALEEHFKSLNLFTINLKHSGKKQSDTTCDVARYWYPPTAKIDTVHVKLTGNTVTPTETVQFIVAFFFLIPSDAGFALKE
jgi:hypothetical protein